ncbi:hypothetical protein MOQ_001883 [Trypanosoma cruzi marinkellei]|uniref:Uncharacterized protein n=1 Tax=Trypanosoma cruzi marinkellei TaxID=85056 RepID=K2P9Y7_TRYCR|nr:hypothetical protein MOQ_001883 [Trypanosoma cruzi marinkellei]
MPLVEQKGSLPRGVAELNAHFLSARADIFTSATLTVEFPPMMSSGFSGNGITGEDGINNRHAALLLTLSPLHEIGEVSVQLERKGKATSDSMEECHQLPLDNLKLCGTKRRVMRINDGGKPVVASPEIVAVDPASSVAGDNKLGVVESEEKNEPKIDEDNGAEEILELVFGSSESEHDTIAGDYDDDDDGDANKNCESVAEEGGNDNTGQQFVLKLWPFAANGTDEMDEEAWFISRCCIEVRLLPPSQLASLSYPRLAVSSAAGKTHSKQEEGWEFGSESYLLLVGQRFYDYFICPRVAYAESGPNAASFAAVDVYVTALRPFSDAIATSWEILPMCSLPVLPEDLVCAFVRPRKGEDASLVAEETHAGVRWRVQHHSAFTVLSSIDGGDASNGKDLYFFNCDHVLSDSLFPLIRLAEKAWEETRSRAAVHVDASSRCRKTTWVVTGCSNTLLSLRRGTLCTRGAVVLVADVLRTVRKTMASPTSLFQANLLRAKAAVLSSALEVLWRMSAGSGVAPEFEFTPSSSALARGWALGLLCNEFGWTELLCQERQVALTHTSASSQVHPWWLTQRYVQETYETLLFLSSAFVVASIRDRRLFPWQFFEKHRKYKPSMEMLGESSVMVSSGMHLLLVQQMLMQRRQEGGGGDVASQPVVFHGSLYYEGIKQHAACCDINLRLNCVKANTTNCLRMHGMRLSHSIWGIDIPFTVVFLAVDTSEASQMPPEGGRKEKRLQCRVTHVLSCCWRVSGLTWARGVDQQASFSILGTVAENFDRDFVKKNETVEKEESEEGNDEQFFMKIPMLVLNLKIVPAALSISVQHDWFWSDLISSLDALARQVILQRIMEESVREGENKVEETELVFTPLMNQLLEGIVGDHCCPSVNSGGNLPATLFLSALRSVDVGVTAIRSRIRPGLYTRFMRLVLKLNLNASVVTGSAGALRRSRGDDERCQLPGFVMGMEEKMLTHIRTVEAYDASLPRPNPRRRQRQEEENEGQGKQLGPRLVLSLRRRSVVQQAEEEKSHQEMRVKNKVQMTSVENPADLAAMVGRIITKGAESNVADDTFLAARSAALSLVLPLWLLLHTRPDMPEAQKTALCDGAEEIYESLRDSAVANDLDPVLLKGYECLAQKVESRMGQRDCPGHS